MDIFYILQDFRTPLLDTFFKFMNFFDRQEFFFFLIPIVWLCVGWKAGFRLFCILFLSSFFNHELKTYFMLPRPFHFDSSLGLIHVAGYGFPSGAAQTAMLLSLMMIKYLESRWKWGLALLFFVSLSTSRIYLGVHFPIDILGGWVVGIGLFLIYEYLFPVVEKQFEKMRSVHLLLLSQILPLPLISESFSSVGMGMGMGIYLLKTPLLKPKNKLEYIVRTAVGIMGAFALFSLFSWLLIPKVVSFYLLGLWVSFICPSIICICYPKMSPAK